jgi:hypothetical protein
MIRYLCHTMFNTAHCLRCIWYMHVSGVGARGSVVGWGTMLQAERSPVQIPMRSLDFFNWPNPSSCTMALGLTQPLTGMSSRNRPGGQGRPASGADNLTTICEPTVLKMWQPQHLTTLWGFMACYRDSFTFLGFGSWLYSHLHQMIGCHYNNRLIITVLIFSVHQFFKRKRVGLCVCVHFMYISAHPPISTFEPVHQRPWKWYKCYATGSHPNTIYH